MNNCPVAIGKQKGNVEAFLHKVSASSYFSLILKHLVELARNLKRSLKPKTIFILAAIIGVIALFGKNLKDVVFVSLLALAASYSTIYKRTIRVPSAVELVTIGTVITGVAYGPVAGAVFGVLTTFASEIISSGIDAFTFFYAVARGTTGAVVFYLAGWNIVTLGMVGVAIFNILCQPIYQMSGDIEQRLKGIYYLIVNTLFNLLVFTFFGKILLKVAFL